MKHTLQSRFSIQPNLRGPWRRVAVVLATACFAATAQSQLPDGPQKAVVLKVCGKCHDVALVADHRQTRDDWTETITQMINAGAKGTEDEFSAVLDYLTRNFGPAINVNHDTAAELEAGLEISKKEAAAIVQYREQKGNFKSVEDIKKVPGVDGSKIEARKNSLVF